MPFQVLGLPAEFFQALFGLHDSALAALGVERQVCAASPGWPCRVSLQDAAVGEPVLLLNWEHQPGPGPYRASHAIFVREGAKTVRPEPGVVPEVLRRRLLSVRAFDDHGRMVEADVTEGTMLTPTIARLLANPTAAYLHLHNAKPGCYAARVERA